MYDQISNVFVPPSTASLRRALFNHPLIFQAGRRLLIQRTFKDEEGRQYTRTEVVKNQPVIDAYLKYITKDKNYRYGGIEMLSLFGVAIHLYFMKILSGYRDCRY